MRRSGVQIPEAAPKETPNDLGGAKRRLPEAAPKETPIASLTAIPATFMSHFARALRSANPRTSCRWAT